MYRAISLLGTLIVFLHYIYLVDGQSRDCEAGRTCIRISNCPVLNALAKDIRNRDSIVEVRKQICGFQRRHPLVCCPGSGGTTQSPGGGPITIGVSPGVTPTRRPTPRPTRRPTPRPTRRPQGNLLPTGRACGHPASDDKVVGGEPAPLGAYPWVVALGYTERGKPGVKFDCGGSLINYRYVLTAAHCLARKYLRNRRLTILHLGDHDLKSTVDCQTSNFNVKRCAPLHMELSPEDTVIHEKFDVGERYSNDIGLIRLNESIQFRNIKAFVSPVCLPAAGVNVRSAVGGREAIAAGWGFTENNTHSEVLLRIGLPFADDGVCRRRYGSQFLPNQLCVGGVKGKDTCSGDSGGPLVIAGRFGPPFTLLGLVSYGPFPCGLADNPGVYTNVADFRDWIERNIRP